LETQATCQESYSYRTGDRPDLDLPGGQLDLIAAVLETGVPTVVVVCRTINYPYIVDLHHLTAFFLCCSLVPQLINGRPVTFGYNNTLLENIPALLEAWRPGEEGGTAIAEIVFGSVSPSGRLANTFTWNVGEIGGPTQPYWQKYRYYDGMIWTYFPSTPLFSFGFGLTYTSFEYSDLVIEPLVVGISPSSSVNFTFTLTNTGMNEGTEVAQLYISDVLASVVRYKKQLFGFSRITLLPSESTSVQLLIAVNDLAFYDSNMQYIVEPGQFNVMIGPNAVTSPLQGSFQVAP
jgi:beta-glucosidase